MRLRAAPALLALIALSGCDPFAPEEGQRVVVTPELRCTQLGGTPAVRTRKDGTPWRVCTFRDTRVCDLVKLRTDNRCYTDVLYAGSPAGS